MLVLDGNTIRTAEDYHRLRAFAFAQPTTEAELIRNNFAIAAIQSRGKIPKWSFDHHYTNEIGKKRGVFVCRQTGAVREFPYKQG